MPRIKLYQGQPEVKGPGSRGTPQSRVQFSGKDFSSNSIGPAITKTTKMFSDINKLEIQSASVEMNSNIANDQIELLQKIPEIEASSQVDGAGHTQDIIDHLNTYQTKRLTGMHAGVVETYKAQWKGITARAVADAVNYSTTKKSTHLVTSLTNWAEKKANIVYDKPETLLLELEASKLFHADKKNTGDLHISKIQELEEAHRNALVYNSAAGRINNAETDEQIKALQQEMSDPSGLFVGELDDQQFRVLAKSVDDKIESIETDLEDTANNQQTEKISDLVVQGSDALLSGNIPKLNELRIKAKELDINTPARARLIATFGNQILTLERRNNKDGINDAARAKKAKQDWKIASHRIDILDGNVTDEQIEANKDAGFYTNAAQYTLAKNALTQRKSKDDVVARRAIVETRRTERLAKTELKKQELKEQREIKRAETLDAKAQKAWEKHERSLIKAINDQEKENKKLEKEEIRQFKELLKIENAVAKEEQKLRDDAAKIQATADKLELFRNVSSGHYESRVQVEQMKDKLLPQVYDQALKKWDKWDKLGEAEKEKTRMATAELKHEELKIAVIDAETPEDLRAIKQSLIAVKDTIYSGKMRSAYTALYSKIHTKLAPKRLEEMYNIEFTKALVDGKKLDRFSMTAVDVKHFNRWAADTTNAINQEANANVAAFPFDEQKIRQNAEQKIASIVTQTGIVPAYIETQFKRALTGIQDTPEGLEGAFNFITSQRELYGESWPTVYTQLVESKVMSPEFSAAARLSDVGEEGPSKDLIRAASMGSALKSSLTNFDAAAFNQGLTDALEDFNKSVSRSDAASPDIINNKKAVKTLAMYYMLSDGLDTEEATQKAADQIFNNYYEYGAGIRMPKGEEDINTIVVALPVIQKHLNDFFEIVGPTPPAGMSQEEANAQAADSYIAHGSWVQAAGDSGVIFVDHQQNPILHMVDGKEMPLTLSWSEIDDMYSIYESQLSSSSSSLFMKVIP